MPYKLIVFDGFDSAESGTGLVFAGKLPEIVDRLNDSLCKNWPVCSMAPDLELNGSLVFLVWDSTRPERYVDALLKKGAKIVALIPEGRNVLPEPVARFLGKGLIYCCREEVLAKRPDDVEKRLRRVMSGVKPFPRFTWLEATKPSKIFLSYPSARPEFESIRMVLETLRIECLNPLGSGGGGTVNGNVTGGISSSNGMICHLGQEFIGDPGNGKAYYNPNVMYEIGYAHSAKTPFVLFGDERDRQRVPSDLQGSVVVEDFDDPIENLQIVYYGLAD